jgi:TatD DNase family protein
MLVDTHVHLYHERYDEDRGDVLQRAREAGVRAMLLPAIDVASIGEAIVLSERDPGVFAMSAIHPSETRNATDADFDAVRTYCAHDRVCAVGESGLDYYWDRSFDEVQQEYLRRHVRLAVETGLPLVLHNREAGGDILRILREERSRLAGHEALRGVFHCFSGPEDLIEPIAQLGFHFGLGGLVTFKNAGVAELVDKLPRDRILLETDGPFLSPVPFRGKRNEPAYLVPIAEEVARRLGLSMVELAELTTANAANLFGFDAAT